MGPIVVFDKSALQSLSVDEAVWLHAFYTPNITPLFFVETLADLEKEVGRGRTPEEVVGNLAEKTAPMGGRVNTHHTELCRAELLGAQVEMRGVPIVAPGDYVETAGRGGIVSRPSKEEEALIRWQRAEFLDVERQLAKSWRNALSTLDLGKWRLRLGGRRARSLVEARKLARDEIDGRRGRYRVVRAALEIADIGPLDSERVIRRWKSLGGPPLRIFAPYAGYVLEIDLFLAAALDASLISDRRATNRVDIAYLYYLPFCMVFTSGDRLHQRVAPLFMRQDQVFVPAAEMKADLARLDEHYSALPPEVLRRGVLSFAHYPPTDQDFLTSRLWDKLMASDWRRRAQEGPVKLTKSQGVSWGQS